MPKSLLSVSRTSNLRVIVIQIFPANHVTGTGRGREEGIRYGARNQVFESAASPLTGNLPMISG